jgi:hypothetical protein
MAQDSSWLRKPMYGVGALLRGYGFGVPLEDEDAGGTKSGKSSGPRYKSKTQQNAELRARQIMQQDDLANQQVSYGNVKGIEGPVQTTDSGEQTGDTILRRALGMDGTNQPALHIERNAEGVPTRATPNYFMPVDKDNMRAQGLANKWIGAGTAKDRESFIKGALAIQKDKTQLLAAESNTAKAATQATIAEERLINVQVAGDKAQIALTRAKLDLAARKDALKTDKTLRTAKEVAAVKDAESDVLKLQKLNDDKVARELTKRNKAADRLEEAQEKETKRLAEIEKQKRVDEKAAFKRAIKAREQDTKDAEQFIKDEATAAKAMAAVVAKERLAEEEAHKYLFKARMKAFRDLSPADQKILKLRTLGPGGALRMGFDAKFTDRIDPTSPTTERAPFSLTNALMGTILPGTLGISRPDLPIPDAERGRLEGPVTDEDWTRMLSPAERGRIMDTLWREAVSNANERKTNAQDEFSLLLVDLEKNPEERMKYMPVVGNTPADIQPLSEDDLLKTLEAGEPLGNATYKVEGLQFKWDRATQKFIRVQPNYNQVG